MHTSDIRAKYIAFFGGRGHVIVPSAPLVPENDPSTLFTGSGMQPMVPYLLGEKHPSGTRVTNSQKCFRSQDIEEVGDNRHTTFFEMLGNWSFGDYFKREQIDWMWTFLTKELGLDPKRLYFTCFRGNDALGIPRDTESAEHWRALFQSAGIEAAIGEDPETNGMREGERIFYYSEHKNWWSRAGMPDNMPIGEPGGGDTEMFWDFDPANEKKIHEISIWKDKPCHVNCDCGRFMEIGNNVFMAYRKTATSFEKLTPPNVDFGGGLERVAAALGDNPDVFQLDLFAEARTTLETLSGKSYDESTETTHAFRVILDHIRAAVFLISDGVLPSNKDQGYFVRRLIRRAIRYGKDLNIDGKFIVPMAKSYILIYGLSYPYLKEKQNSIIGELSAEEEKFQKTIEIGLREFRKTEWLGVIDEELPLDKTYGTVRGHTEEFLPGKVAFDLYQTYGFPLELIEEEVSRKGVKVNKKEFEEEVKKHQDLSRTASAGKFKGGLADNSAKVTAFHTATHLMLAGLRKELGPDVHQAGSNITEERTRFDFTYPEKVPREALDRVEQYVNEAIKSGATVGTTVMEKSAAKAAGVEGSFWEKYPEKVTVYQVKGADGTVYSQELCGGPHVATTTDIASFGRFRITKEEASSAGVRRIKAILE